MDISFSSASKPRAPFVSSCGESDSYCQHWQSRETGLAPLRTRHDKGSCRECCTRVTPCRYHASEYQTRWLENVRTSSVQRTILYHWDSLQNRCAARQDYLHSEWETHLVVLDTSPMLRWTRDNATNWLLSQPLSCLATEMKTALPVPRPKSASIPLCY